MRVLTLGFKFNPTTKYDIAEMPLKSGGTLIDGEVVLWDMGGAKILPGNSDSSNYIAQRNHSSLKIILENRRKEFDEFFKMGRCLIITNPLFDKFQYLPEEENGSGLGDLSYAQCLDIAIPNLEKKTGKNIQPITEEFVVKYFDSQRGRFHYHEIFINPSGIPLMYIKETNYVVSQYCKIGEGIVLFLPRFSVDYSSPSDINIFFDQTLSLLASLKSFKPIKPMEYPEWVKEYEIIGEREELDKLEKLIKKRTSIENQINHQEQQLSYFNELKALVGSTGTQLENIVVRIITEIGFKAIKPSGNRDDLIINYGKRIAVVEIKGVAKSAAEKHAAQLTKWVANYYSEKGENPKGILMVNTYRDTPLRERQGPDFPDQMLAYSTQMKHCLMTCSQLLCLYIDFKTEKISANKLVDKIFNTIGELKYTDKIETYIFKSTE